VDIIHAGADFSSYQLLIAPMLYMLKPGVAERIRAFVAAGGTMVTTYCSGIVDENDLCFLGGWPGAGLREVLGIWDEETDTLPVDERNHIIITQGGELGLKGSFEARDYFALIHAESARVLATFAADFYAGRPALTVNDFGRGQAYYVASRNDEAFADAFLGALAQKLALRQALPGGLPEGVTAQVREDGNARFIFVMNFNPTPAAIALGQAHYQRLLDGSAVSGTLELPAYGVEILKD
jgi:beta-galactosidase